MKEIWILKGVQGTLKLQRNQKIKIKLLTAHIPQRKKTNSNRVLYLCSPQVNQRTINDKTSMQSIHTIIMKDSKNLIYNNMMNCDDVVCNQSKTIFFFLSDENGTIIHTSEMFNQEPIFKILITYIE